MPKIVHICIRNVQTVQYWTLSFHVCSKCVAVDESARSQQIHYIDLPVVILTPQITVLADLTTGEICPSGFSLQRFDQPVKRHIPMGTIF